MMGFFTTPRRLPFLLAPSLLLLLAGVTALVALG
jgi:hypothetical protein